MTTWSKHLRPRRNLPKQRSRIVWLSVLVAVVAALSGSVDLGAQDWRDAQSQRKFDKRLRERLAMPAQSAEDHERVIIRLRPGAKSAMLSVLQSQGAAVAVDHSIIEAVTVDLSTAQLRTLAQSDVVETISTDADVKADGIADGVSGEPNYQDYSLVRTLGLPDRVTWYGYSGRNVTVAVVDSGLVVDDSTRIKTTRDFTTGDPLPWPKTASDGYGHGTHIAGLIGENGSGNRGLAPDVNYVSLQVLDSQGVGRTSDVIKSIEWAVANRWKYDIDVL